MHRTQEAWMERENLWVGVNKDRNCGIELEKIMILIFKFFMETKLV